TAARTVSECGQVPPALRRTCSQNQRGHRNRVDCGRSCLKAADQWAETGETGNRDLRFRKREGSEGIAKDSTHQPG
ncbi:hypothetical protein HaLaN_27583, partial [Haematococcus lacustris]